MTLRSSALRSTRVAARRALAFLTLAFLVSPRAVAADQVVVRDRFNGSVLAKHAPDTNLPQAAWSVTGSGAVLWGQRAWASGADWSGILATIDSGVADGTIGVDWTPGGDVPYGAVVARASDAANYLVAYYWSGTLSLSRVTSTGATLLASTPLADPGTATHRLTLVLAGSSIQVWYDGVRRLSATDAFNVAVTRHGFRWLSHYDWQSTYGNFEVDGSYAPPAATVTVAPTPLQVSLLNSGTLTATAYDTAHQVIPDVSFSWSSSNPSAVAIVPLGNNSATAFALGAGSATITAVPTRGASGAATVSVNTGAFAVLDTFTGNDATQLTAHAPDVGIPSSAWSVTGSGASLRGNHASASGADWDPITATIDAGIADGTIGVDWTPAGPNPAAAIVARAANATSYLTLVYWSRTLSLYRVSNDTNTLIGEATVADPSGSTHHVELKLAGPAIEVWWDRVQQIVAIDSHNVAATRHGFRWYSYWDWQSTYDRFEVSALPAVASVTVTPASATIPMNGGRVLTAQASDSSGAAIPGISFSWSSSNPAVATTRVASSTSGAVVAESAGFATITATAFGGRAQGAVDVTVTPPPPPPSAAGCIGGVFPAGMTWPADGGIGQVTVSAPSKCEWTTDVTAPWITPLQTIGTGDAMLSYAIDRNETGRSRSATLQVGGATFSISQTEVFTGGPPRSSGSSSSPVGSGGTGCTVTLSKPEGTVSSSGGPISVSVAAPIGCEWRASDAADWLTVVSSSGVGNGTVAIVAQANAETAWRLGTVSIGGKPFAVLQDGTAIPAPPIGTAPESAVFDADLAGQPCTYQVYPSKVVVAYGGGGTVVHVIAPQVCPWTPTTDAAWLTFSDQESIPKQVVVVTATANLAASGRSAAVRIGSVTLEIYQEGTASERTAPSPAIEWFLTPDEKKVGECLGNCGAGCTDQIPYFIGPAVFDGPAPCGPHGGWTLEALTPAVYTGDAMWVTTCDKPNGREKQERYDLYTATGRYTYHGRWASQCAIHDESCRSGTGSPIECGLSLANPVFDIAILLCLDAKDETWSYPAVGQPGVPIFGRSKLPNETVLTGNRCPAIP